MMKKGGVRGKLSYGVGAVGLDLSYGLFYNYLAKYLTDVLLLKNNFLLFLTPIARIWDGVNDPMMGTIVDNGRMKMGKYRPWILIGSFSNALVLTLLFSNPLHLSGTPLYAYVAVLYVAWGMTNTMADIPYWSMVPSFTSDPAERSIIATIARTFSGAGQGIISIFTPIVLPLLSVKMMNGEKVWDAYGFSRWAMICSLGLIVFSSFSVSRTREKHITKPKEKFTFKKMFSIARHNDQLLIFMLFAMLSNAGWYMVSGVGAYYFDVVLGKPDGQSVFNLFGSAGSILGLAVIPIMMKFTSRRRTYQFSLALALVGFAGMFFSSKIPIVMNVCFLLASIGIASMFISQTVFLADIVDYGEVKQGFRSESIIFSMKGFLQKMAYTLQTIVLFSGLSLSGYDGTLHAQNSQTAKNAISFMMLIAPAILILLSLLLFTFKFKLHGKYMEEITAKVTANRAAEEAAAAQRKTEDGEETAPAAE